MAIQKKILLVDDESSVRAALSRMLTLEDYHVVPVSNSREALQKVSQERIDSVVINLDLPNEDAWDTLQRVSAVCPSLPAIAITARPQQTKVPAGVAVGAVMEKPLDLPLLLRTLQESLCKPTPAGVETGVA